MKTLKEVFVIVEQNPLSDSEFFQDYISFDKEELDLKCKVLNKERNDAIEKIQRKNKKLSYYIPITFFIVLPLSEAIEKIKDMVTDSCTIHDASY